MTAYSDWKDFVSLSKELSVELTKNIKEILPWVKFFLGATSFAMICSGLTFLKFLVM